MILTQLNSYDLIILDIAMPSVDGLFILKELKLKNKDISVIIISKRSRIEDKVKCFKLGADDYLSKPFSFIELLARIQTVLRRKIPLVKKQIILFENLEVDFNTHKVKISGDEVKLTPKEFLLLKLLIEKKDL